MAVPSAVYSHFLFNYGQWLYDEAQDVHQCINVLIDLLRECDDPGLDRFRELTWAQQKDMVIDAIDCARDMDAKALA